MISSELFALNACLKNERKEGAGEREASAGLIGLLSLKLRNANTWKAINDRFALQSIHDQYVPEISFQQHHKKSFWYNFVIFWKILCWKWKDPVKKISSQRLDVSFPHRCHFEKGQILLRTILVLTMRDGRRAFYQEVGLNAVSKRFHSVNKSQSNTTAHQRARQLESLLLNGQKNVHLSLKCLLNMNIFG